MKLRTKLIISYICFIILPITILGFFTFYFYSKEIQNTVVKSSVQNNQKVIKNLDTLITTLSKLSEYPLNDDEILSILRKNYNNIKNPKYENSKDFQKITGILYSKIKSFSNVIDSVYLYQSGKNEIIGRTPAETINVNYSISEEKWFEKIKNKKGDSSVVGIHKNMQELPRNKYVISIGRSILDPVDGEKVLGYIIINIKVDSLENHLLDTPLTDNTMFYLIDSNNNIVFSQNKIDIGLKMDNVLQNIDIDKIEWQIKKINNTKHYVISSKSELSDFNVVTIIPQNELFPFRDKLLYITILIALIIVALSIIIATLIATSVTKPIHKLNKQMQLVRKGNLDVNIDSDGGEFDFINKTVHNMMIDIKELIDRIYIEEEKKRNTEINVLQSQINPHFLYNTLNTIKWMANMQGATSISNALNSLSFLLFFYSKWKMNLIPISEEIKFIEKYIEILNLRYYNKFDVKITVDDEVYNFKTLKFILQPLIENAINHGFENLKKKGLIKISILCDSGKIIFKIEDNGKGMDEKTIKLLLNNQELEKNNCNSIGLANIRERINLNFGEEFGISIKSLLNVKTIVTVTIPEIPLDK